MSNRLSYLRGTLAAPSLDGELVFTASAEGMNRHGFSLNRKKWKIDNFNNNPVILWMHMDHMPPIGRGRATLDSSGLRTSVVFDRNDPFAMEIERKYRAGFMNAVSVGFDFVDSSGAPLMDWWSMSPEEMAHESWYDLAEISAVPVPADPNALIRQRQALAADFGLWDPEEISKMSVFDLGARSRSLAAPQPPAFPTLPGNSDLEARLSAIEETLSRLAPTEPAPPEDAPVEEEPVEDEIDSELASGLLASLTLTSQKEGSDHQ